MLVLCRSEMPFEVMQAPHEETEIGVDFRPALLDHIESAHERNLELPHDIAANHDRGSRLALFAVHEYFPFRDTTTSTGWDQSRRVKTPRPPQTGRGCERRGRQPGHRCFFYKGDELLDRRDERLADAVVEVDPAVMEFIFKHALATRRAHHNVRELLLPQVVQVSGRGVV